MKAEDKFLLQITLLIIATGLVLVRPEELFREDSYAHFVLSAIISLIYYSWRSESSPFRGLVFQSIVVCITVGVLKEVAFDSIIGINDIFADTAGAVFGVLLRSKTKS